MTTYLPKYNFLPRDFATVFDFTVDVPVGRAAVIPLTPVVVVAVPSFERT
jgi:hypothetical protein